MSANFTVDATTLDEQGYVRIAWTNAGKLGTFVAWRVYRRYPPTSAWTLIHSNSSNDSSMEYLDYKAKANTEIQYSVVQAYTSGGNTVETAHSPITVNTTSESYWLIHPTTSLSMKLSYVTSDSFDDDFEQESLNLIGRGRKVDQGDRWGVKGTLTVQIRDRQGVTAAQQLANLRAILASATAVELKTPFGDLWKVSLKNPTYDRLAGVSTRPFVDVTLPYEEVA
jgi:hypothetical protein